LLFVEVGPISIPPDIGLCFFFFGKPFTSQSGRHIIESSEEEITMSAFYGSIVGSRGEATRCGTKNSGLKVAAQSWDGSVITRLSYDADGKLNVTLEVAEGSSSGYGSKELFSGTLDQLRKKLGRK
jgi:hypothetical protein